MQKLIGTLLVVFIAVFAYNAWRSPSEQTQHNSFTSTVSEFFQHVRENTTRNILSFTSGSAPAQIADGSLGEYSPYANKVVISLADISALSQGGVRATHVADEYIRISALSSNTAPINITGWGIESMVSGEKHYIPGAARVFIMNEVNDAQDIWLAPGEEAVLTSGMSPVGASFKTNLCTGYLGSVQYFEPPLERECPTPAYLMPPTPDNINKYGDSCIDFSERFSRCTYLTNSTRGIDALEPLCRAYLQNTLTYTTCVVQNQSTPNFLKNEWRVFLGSTTELWRDSHEIIRLSDIDGRTVDVINY